MNYRKINRRCQGVEQNIYLLTTCPFISIGITFEIFPSKINTMKNLIRTLDKTLGEALPKNYTEFFDDFLQSDFRHKESDVQDELLFSLPGFKKDEISITVNGSYLNIFAEKKQNDNLFRSKFERNVLIGNFDPQFVEASLEDGILKIIIPKKKQGIEIKVK